MARTRRIASRHFGNRSRVERHFECDAVVALAYQDVQRAARICLGQLVADSLGNLATPQPKAVAPMRRGRRTPGIMLEPQVSSARPGDGALGHVRWDARGLRWLVPTVHADLAARPVPGGGTRLVLDATCRPAGGLLGIVSDGLVGRLVARSTAESFIDRLAETMVDAVRDHHCGRWSSTRAIDAAS